jgi:hypothetical protein
VIKRGKEFFVEKTLKIINFIVFEKLVLGVFRSHKKALRRREW